MKKGLLALALVFVCSSSGFAADAKETVFERVNRTGVIRCGYFTWSPFLMIDPNTKQASGIYHDVIEEIGNQLHLKIEWTEDTGQSNPFEGMKTGRFDMFCGPITPTPDRSKQVAFSRPFFYIPYYAYARADDARFITAKNINDPKTKIAVIDGEFAHEIVKRDFPKASQLTLPALSDGAQVMMSVTSKKADIFLNDSAATAVFMDKNPGQIKIASKEPLRTLAAVVVLPQNDMAFKTMIDTVLDQLLEDRFVDGVVAKYALKDSSFLPVAKGYTLSKTQ